MENIKSPTMLNNFYCNSKCNNFLKLSHKYSDDDILWQENTYKHAKFLADPNIYKRVVDIGTGAGKKLPMFFGDINRPQLVDKVYFFQVDFSDNREDPKDNFAEFVQINLEDCDEVLKLREKFDDDTPTIYILSDVIEHLFDPRPLLATLRYLLKKNDKNKLVISTPDRERIDGKNNQNAPDNPTHVRQWTKKEFDVFLSESAFHIDEIVYTQQNKFDENNVTILATTSCNEEFYNNWLIDNHMPEKSGHLLITTEHSSLTLSGGIGSYIKYTDYATPEKRMILFIGGFGLNENWQETVKNNRWFHVGQISDKETIHDYDRDEILEAVFHLLYIYETINIIEYQDYCGIGFRVSQAKDSCLLPQQTKLVAIAHGNHYYLENAKEELEHRDITIDVLEKISLEKADHVVFATTFLKNLYEQQQGMKFKDARLIRFPIKIDRNEDFNSYEALSTLIFFGKRTQQKGYYDFCNALMEIKKSNRYQDLYNRIRKVIFIGVNDVESEIKQNFKDISYGIYPSEEAIGIIKKNIANSLVVLPYCCDNYPMSVFEVIRTGGQLLIKDAGGIRDIVTEKNGGNVLYKNDLAKAINEKFNQPFWERINTIKLLKRNVEYNYNENFRKFNDFFKCLYEHNNLITNDHGTISLVISNFKGSTEYLNDVYEGIKNSIRIPDEIVIIDDHSPEEYLAIVENFFNKLKNICANTKLIIHEKNKGLCAARNTGIKNSGSDYILFHDNDNIMLNNNINTLAKILDKNKNIDATTSYSLMFKDKTNWKKRSITQSPYMPIGQDLALALSESLNWNCFGDAHGLFRRKMLVEINGYDETTRAMWEDFQLYVRMTLKNKRIALVPKPLFLYRIRENSMLRTYKIYPAFQRLERSLIEAGIDSGELLLRCLVSKVEQNGIDWKNFIVSQKRAKKILTSKSRTFLHLLKLIFVKRYRTFHKRSVK